MATPNAKNKKWAYPSNAIPYSNQEQALSEWCLRNRMLIPYAIQNYVKCDPNQKEHLDAGAASV